MTYGDGLGEFVAVLRNTSRLPTYSPKPLRTGPPTPVGAVCWQPTGVVAPVGIGLGRYVGKLQVLQGLVAEALLGLLEGV